MSRFPALSVSLAGLARAPGAPWGDGPRTAIEWAAAAGFRIVQLDAAMPGVRARDLDRSARRDVASLLRRMGLVLSGLDLWIPEQHFLDAGQVSRAVAAVESAIELAADLRGVAEDRAPVLSVRLPEKLEGSIRSQIAGAADRNGVAVADHRPLSELPAPAEGMLGVGIDPAAILQSGGEVLRSVARVRGGPRSARVGDWSGSRRMVPGSLGGRLDLLAYAASLDVAGYRRAAVVDLRELDDPAGAVRAVRERWPGA